MKSSAVSIYCSTVYCISFILLCLYGYMTFTNFDQLILPRNICLYISTFFSLLYLWLFRRKNLCCFEFIFFPLFILSFYFQEIVLNNLDLGTEVFFALSNSSFISATRNQTLILQLLGFFFFLTGALLGNRAQRIMRCTVQGQKININYKTSINCLCFIVGVYLVYLLENGTIKSWFQYSNSNNNFNNTDIVYLTILFLPMTIMEFTKLADIGCKSIREIIRHINKIYLFEIVLTILLLMISGNRNEALLIALPIVGSYTFFINKIKSSYFVVGLLSGVFLMIFIGMTRQDSVDLSKIRTTEFGIFENTRDYSFVDINTAYLVEYTNKNGPIYFKNGFLNIISAVPFLGTIIKSTFNIDYDIRSPEIATVGLQDAKSDSGLGTSIIGDLYYTAGVFFVILFMLFMGWLMAYCYNFFYMYKRRNVWLAAIFLFNFSNSVYFIRAEWIMPFRYVGFTCIIILLCSWLFPKKHNYSIQGLR